MVVSVRAVYKEGQLRLLDPVDLAEGQIVDVTIQADAQQRPLTPNVVNERLRSAGILLEFSTADDTEELSAEERHRIGVLFAGGQPSEDLIDEDRGLY